MQSSKFWSENGGANKKKFLMRPIIAICNDLYAPALEKLRVNAEIITFNQIDESSLRDRLKFICANEKVRFTNQQLKEIITLTNFDIRSCLNILQFSGDDSINKGQKDMQTSWYSIVSQLFKKDPRLSKRQQFKNLQHLINTHHSNFEKIINGCFQTYTDVHYQDISLSKPSLISDWLYFSDLVQRTQYDSSGVDLSHYSELTALQFFSQFSDVSNSNLKIKSDWEYFDKTRTNNSILKVIFTKLSTTLKTVFKMDDLVIDLLPSLDYIMIPEISKRSTNSLVKKDSTLKKVNNAVNAINSAGLLINKSKDENYNEIYRTFPDFTHITKFDPTSIKRQQVRQSQVFPTLVKELEHHKIMKRKIDSTKDSDDVIADVNDIDVLKTQYNQIAENERLAKRQKTQTDIKIWVRYHEGFSNAVRKKVRWDDLWS
jgi:chromosome transmission fidelity protein 18